MKKRISVIGIWVLLIVLLGNSTQSHDGIILKYYPSNSLLKQLLYLDDNAPINEIVMLPEQKFDEEKAAAIIKNVQQLPPSLLAKIQQNGIYLKLFVGKLTDNPSAKHLKGLIPRGYTSQKKWDEVPGIGGGRVVLVKIGHSEKGMGHGSINLELHELAHSIDRIVYNKLRFDPVFLHIWTNEKHALFQNQAYFITLPEEYFAEAFAMYYVNEENRTILKNKAPLTHEYIKNLK
ncbi:toxin [Robertmurraya sp. DFI.2.37]|uniref:anthrax toxin lethal factor-related metalloendopeptidase n=1 Tax=Robertmurraya sp. DFI.2.37 TaxID=3031819 RepID=UPI0023DABA87|nr:toxin [Robertmurraya sp. DFI.2.37]MDF1510375.1 toxin [Robertmurraya sp. DFI.2.37]